MTENQSEKRVGKTTWIIVTTILVFVGVPPENWPTFFRPEGGATIGERAISDGSRTYVVVKNASHHDVDVTAQLDFEVASMSLDSGESMESRDKFGNLTLRSRTFSVLAAPNDIAVSYSIGPTPLEGEPLRSFTQHEYNRFVLCGIGLMTLVAFMVYLLMRLARFGDPLTKDSDEPR